MKAKRFLLFLLLVALILTGLLVDSRYRLVTTQYTLHSELLPDSFRGYSIVQLSDLHGASFGTDNSSLVDTVRALSPDLIALTGDFIENEEQIPNAQSLIRQLTDIAPVYYVSGNHDWASGSISALRFAVEESGATYLSNEYMPITHNGDSILLAGVEDPNGYAEQITPDALIGTAAANYPNVFTVLLAHRNDFVSKYPVLPCDLILTGHGHGGVIRLPFIGGLFGTDLQFFPKYDSGVFSADRYNMVVSRGLGDAPLLPRFLNNPEIVQIILEK